MTVYLIAVKMPKVNLRLQGSCCGCPGLCHQSANQSTLSQCSRHTQSGYISNKVEYIKKQFRRQRITHGILQQYPANNHCQRRKRRGNQEINSAVVDKAGVRRIFARINSKRAIPCDFAVDFAETYHDRAYSRWNQLRHIQNVDSGSDISMKNISLYQIVLSDVLKHSDWL
ncbi:hypothetical protein ACJMK2_026746 [Sinanodonta woodiana]|uniref:Uncharacterized protein n=1 Tax=Sinanodonta woodiana TaxID=1069815 RepID=A0ABD3XMW3_SINWO